MYIFYYWMLFIALHTQLFFLLLDALYCFTYTTIFLLLDALYCFTYTTIFLYLHCIGTACIICLLLPIYCIIIYFLFVITCWLHAFVVIIEMRIFIRVGWFYSLKTAQQITEEKKSNTQQWPLYKPINNLRNIPTNLHEWVWVLLGISFKWPCATYNLWQKQQAGNIHVYKNKINNS